MGFYDSRCMITGVSLKGAWTSLVLLEPVQGVLQPVSLACTGEYNRLGSMDSIDETESTKVLFDYFAAKLKIGEFVVDEEYLRAEDCYPFEDIEKLFKAFERNINDHPKAALLHGQTIKFALIAEAVWDAIVASGAAAPEPDAKRFPRLFEIYAGHQTKEVAESLRDLTMIDALVTSRHLTWHADEEPSQHYGDDMKQFLEDAKKACSDAPPLLKGLKDYAEEVAELLEEE